MNLTPGDYGAIVGIIVLLGGPAYGFTYRALKTIRTNDIHHLDLKLGEIDASVKDLDVKVDALALELKSQFGKLEGLELGERVTHLERYMFNGPDEGASERARRVRKAR